MQNTRDDGELNLRPPGQEGGKERRSARQPCAGILWRATATPLVPAAPLKLLGRCSSSRRRARKCVAFRCQEHGGGGGGACTGATTQQQTYTTSDKTGEEDFLLPKLAESEGLHRVQTTCFGWRLEKPDGSHPPEFSCRRCLCLQQTRM